MRALSTECQLRILLGKGGRGVGGGGVWGCVWGCGGVCGGALVWSPVLILAMGYGHTITMKEVGE
jgi:hypothetical protein